MRKNVSDNHRTTTTITYTMQNRTKTVCVRRLFALNSRICPVGVYCKSEIQEFFCFLNFLFYLYIYSFQYVSSIKMFGSKKKTIPTSIRTYRAEKHCTIWVNFFCAFMYLLYSEFSTLFSNIYSTCHSKDKCINCHVF